MKRALLVAALLGCAFVAAGFGGFGDLGNQFSRLGGGSKAPVFVPPPAGKVLLVDAVSFLLQTDGASKVCRAGGC